MTKWFNRYDMRWIIIYVWVDGRNKGISTDDDTTGE
jgi:hypothetical protein